ncbi:ATP-binding protein [Accumulibacter sp.]|uniref:ATP-binding protein n=1 Tax=Accumulibacter sp. TaxID=2053492 RepID=UPI0025EC8479|nr:ATP-binding protein [Accumulibacter sp.]MCM8596968.1 ATP-binding protein [Accumulibacter sp.]MCM8624462.1 ATP-binding protein [Accumulibacter sp.]MDS4051117.1 ATP-binding protein [Accumulibacter sp.]
MAGALRLVVCRHFAGEAVAAVAAEGWDDVQVSSVCARCGCPPLGWDELQPAIGDAGAALLVLGRPCLVGLDRLSDCGPLRRRVLDQCFHLVADPGVVDQALAEGAYLVSPGWLADWRGHLSRMGFGANGAAEFFAEFARRIVLLDTGIDSAAPALLAEMAKSLGLPAGRLSVGLGQCRQTFARSVLEWRLDEARATIGERDARIARNLAEHFAAIDLFARLARSSNEAEVLTTIGELFGMLFAPGRFYHVTVENSVANPDATVPQDLLGPLLALQDDYDWTPSGRGFMLRIARRGEVLGLLAVDELACPQHRERYLNHALAMSGVCALAIENARARERLLAAKKMASLGALVAGVAHEINTPLGIALTASSTMHGESREIVERLAAGCLSRSDLTRHLDRARSANRLVRSSLERIARLVDSFHQVALDERPDERLRFSLRDCLDQVVRSFGAALSGDRVAVRLECDPRIEIESFFADWVCVLVNLIGNSLRHAFVGRARGQIMIGVVVVGGSLHLDYRDDGRGLQGTEPGRVFEPFFTTDHEHGAGLGLFMVHNLVTHRLGGRIRCCDDSGQGLGFHLEVPR